MLKIKPMTRVQLEAKIRLALAPGPKTLIAIRLYLEMRHHVWISDEQVVDALDRMVRDGQCHAQELGLISGLDEIDGRPRFGPSILYSLAEADEERRA